MAMFRINKNNNYTTMSNYHLRDKNLSLKAKGLLSMMLSLPDDWGYSVAGLVVICKENETAIKSALNELKEWNYLEIKKCLPNETKSGRYEYIYDIYENPKKKEDKIEQNEIKQDIGKQEVEILPLEFLGVEKQTIEIQEVENQRLLNTNIQNTEIQNIKKEKKKNKYGEYGRVLLTSIEHDKLKKDFENVDELIEFLDEYIERKGYKAKSHYLCIRGWVKDAVMERKMKENRRNEQKAKSNCYINDNQTEFNDLSKFYTN